MSLMRSRWAAIGAAVAVTLGAGGLISVNAANETSSLVPITPARILDTRSGDRVGSLDTAGASDPYRLKVVGTDGIPTSGVTAVSLNVTAVDTRTNDYGGFVSVYPCASVSTAKPDVSNMNFGSGQTIANAVTVPVSTDGHICLYVYGTAHLLVDANGYYTQAGTGAIDAYTKAETDTKLATKADQTTVDTLDSDKADVSALLALATGMQTPVTIAYAGWTGNDPSTAIGTNGFPIITFNDENTDDLRVAACTTVGCTGAPTITTIDSADAVGFYSSIAIGNNGLPVISYHDYTNYDLKVAACTTTDCTGTAIITTVDSADAVGFDTSIAIGNNGLPVISYYDSTNGDLKVAACTSSSCSTATITTVDSTGDVGSHSSIAIRENGFPVISYHDFTNTVLKVAACTTTDCTGTATITTIDPTGDVGEYTSIAIGNNGLPVISYHNSTDDDLKVAACTTTDCTGTATISTVDSADAVGFYTSIAIRENGFPVVSYYDATHRDLKIAVCTTTDCAGASLITTVDSTDNIGLYPSIAISATGLPIISYYDATNSDLKVVPMWSLLIGN